MAIALDAVGTGGTTDNAASLTFAHTCTGSNLILFVGAFTSGDDPATDRVTGVTYNGVAMTRVNTKQQGNISAYLYYLVAPATGANNVIISTQASTNIRGGSVSYTGASQTGVPDSSNTAGNGGVSTLTASTTVVAANCWLVSAHSNNVDTPTAGTGTTGRFINSPFGIGDSNGTVSTGSQSMAWDTPSNGHLAICIASFAPFVAVAIGGDDYAYLMSHIFLAMVLGSFVLRLI